MSQTALYSLRFDPIYQYRLWGGQQFAELLTTPPPAGGPIGEAWVLSDRDDHMSKVSNGTLKGQTIAQLLQTFPQEVMGRLAERFLRFPLLLKFLDAKEMLSAQVHPDGKDGKTEAWVVLEAAKQSRIYAGLIDGTTEDDIRSSLLDDKLPEKLVSFHPEKGDAVFIPSGTVHSLGGDIVVFEIQQNSDTTYRLYDWGHIDASTGHQRPLQVDLALASIDFAECESGLVRPVLEEAWPLSREKLFDCDYFWLTRLRSHSPFAVGAADLPRILVCIDGTGNIQHDGATYPIGKGDVYLLPAAVGACSCLPSESVSVLEIGIPE